MRWVNFYFVGMITVCLAGLACVSSDEPTAPDLSPAESAPLLAASSPGHPENEVEYIDVLERLEWLVIRNMYQIQRGFERFAELNNGIYPIHEYSALVDGRILEDLLPTGYFPINPFTGGTTGFSWNNVPHATPGEIAATTATGDGYIIRAYGADNTTLLDLILTNE